MKRMGALHSNINIVAALPLTTMRHCRSSPCGIAAHQNAALPLMSFAVIYMQHCRLCGWMDEASGVPTLKYQYRCGVAAHYICCHLHAVLPPVWVVGKAVVFSAIAITKRYQWMYTCMRSLLGDDSDLWVIRAEAIRVKNEKISAITTVLSSLRARSRLLQAIEVPLVDSSRSLLWHPRSSFPPAHEKRRNTVIGILDISAELHVRVRKWQWAGLRVKVHLVLVV